MGSPQSGSSRIGHDLAKHGSGRIDAPRPPLTSWLSFFQRQSNIGLKAALLEKSGLPSFFHCLESWGFGLNLHVTFDPHPDHHHHHHEPSSPHTSFPSLIPIITTTPTTSHPPPFLQPLTSWPGHRLLPNLLPIPRLPRPLRHRHGRSLRQRGRHRSRRPSPRRARSHVRLTPTRLRLRLPVSNSLCARSSKHHLPRLATTLLVRRLSAGYHHRTEIAVARDGGL